MRLSCHLDFNSNQFLTANSSSQRVNPEDAAIATMHSVAGAVLAAEAAASAAFTTVATFEAVTVGIADAVDAGLLRLSVQC